MKTPEEFMKLYGLQKSTRNKRQVNLFNNPSEQESREESNQDDWSKARQVKYNQLKIYGVYLVVDKKTNLGDTKVVNTKWVYKIKRKPDRTITKYKARKVRRGFLQKYAINYDKTYA